MFKLDLKSPGSFHLFEKEAISVCKDAGAKKRKCLGRNPRCRQRSPSWKNQKGQVIEATGQVTTEDGSGAAGAPVGMEMEGHGPVGRPILMDTAMAATATLAIPAGMKDGQDPMHLKRSRMIARTAKNDGAKPF